MQWKSMGSKTITNTELLFKTSLFVLYRRKNINVYKWSQNFRFCVNYPFKSISDKDSLPNVKRVSLML